MNTPAADPLPRCGAGIVLRRLSPADLPAFQAYRGDPELGRYQGWSAMQDAEALAFLEEMHASPLFRPGQWAQIGIVAPEATVLLGDIGLYLANDSRHAEMGFTLSRPAQGRGLATAAVRAALQLLFDSTRVESVVGITDARNLASMKLLERLGLSRQAERRVVYRGEPCVEYVYAVRRTGT